MRGRPPKYKEDFHPEQVYLLARQGITVTAIAEIFGINRDTFYAWKHEHPIFSDNHVLGLDEYNVRVAEQCLMQKVQGRHYTEVKKEPVHVTKNGQYQYDEDGQPIMEMQIVETKRKYMPPSDAAIQFHLTRRAPKRWPSKQQVELSGPGGTPVAMITAETTPQEAAALYAQMIKETT